MSLPIISIGIIKNLPFILNICKGIIFFINPPKGGSPPSDSREAENSNSLVGVIFIFLKEDKCVRFFVEHNENTRVFFII